MASELPHDDDGDALRRLQADGSDLSRPLEIDFTVVAKDEADARSVAKAAASAGYESDLYEDAESGDWECDCSKTMVPTYAAVIGAQEELGRLAQPYGAYVDGWGSFGNADDG